MNKLMLRAFAICSVSFLISCASEPKVIEFSSNANPQVELEKINASLEKAESEQLDILAPKNFKAATKARDEAMRARSNNRKQTKVLHKIALSQTYLNQAQTASNVASELLRKPIAARRDALEANAKINFKNELMSIDNDFLILTTKFEKNDTTTNDKERDSFEDRYKDIELKSIKKSNLGYAQKM
jgi:hypothetical protein